MTDATDPTALVSVKEVPGAPLVPERAPDPCALVIFGATGDLTRRKLIPALYNLMAQDALPGSVAVVGFSRRPQSGDEFRAGLREAMTHAAAGRPPDRARWERFAAGLDYVAGTFDAEAGYRALKERLAATDRERGTRGNRIYYLATPPDAYPVILDNLSRAGLLAPSGGAGPWSRVVLEKPIGRDLVTARALNDLTARFLDETQVFRIDHYLGKETVQNILVFRFANSIFEPIWNRKYIDHVQITAAESIGIEGRGAFYERMGVVRDVVQNHLLQVLSLCAMEPPVSFGADDVRDGKGQVLRALRPLDGAGTAGDVVFGQYRGYRQEAGVAADSRTPTFVAMKVMIDNWRWQGVPFYLRAGKRLARRVTEVAVRFQDIPLCLFGQEAACQIIDANVLTLRIQPDEGVALRFVVKVPGDQVSVGNVLMTMSYAGAFGRPLADAYERLLLDCMLGDATLFTRRDGVEQAWQFVTPILEAWDAAGGPAPAAYDPGSAGPAEADALPARDRRRWRDLE